MMDSMYVCGELGTLGFFFVSAFHYTETAFVAPQVMLSWNCPSRGEWYGKPSVKRSSAID